MSGVTKVKDIQGIGFVTYLLYDAIMQNITIYSFIFMLIAKYLHFDQYKSMNKNPS